MLSVRDRHFVVHR